MQKTNLKSIDYNRSKVTYIKALSSTKMRRLIRIAPKFLTILYRLPKLQMIIDSNTLYTQNRDSCVQFNAKHGFEIDQ